MTSNDFAMWLNGFFELANPTTLSEVQIEIIKDHLALVIEKKTPDRFKDSIVNPKEEKKKTAAEEVLENLKLNPLTEEEVAELMDKGKDLSQKIKDTINLYKPNQQDCVRKVIC